MSYSLWQGVKYKVTQRSFLGPLLFNIFINDISYFTDEAKFANYADDTTISLMLEHREILLNVLETKTIEVLIRFRVNEMQANDDKCNLIVPQGGNVSITLGNGVIVSVDSVDLLGIEIESCLTFDNHVLNLCEKGNQKLHSLVRVSKNTKPDKLKIIMKTFIESQFNYCPHLNVS